MTNNFNKILYTLIALIVLTSVAIVGALITINDTPEEVQETTQQQPQKEVAVQEPITPTPDTETIPSQQPTQPVSQPTPKKPTQPKKIIAQQPTQRAIQLPPIPNTELLVFPINSEMGTAEPRLNHKIGCEYIEYIGGRGLQSTSSTSYTGVGFASYIAPQYTQKEKYGSSKTEVVSRYPDGTKKIENTYRVFEPEQMRKYGRIDHIDGNDPVRYLVSRTMYRPDGTEEIVEQYCDWVWYDVFEVRRGGDEMRYDLYDKYNKEGREVLMAREIYKKEKEGYINLPDTTIEHYNADGKGKIERTTIRTLVLYDNENKKRWLYEEEIYGRDGTTLLKTTRYNIIYYEGTQKVERLQKIETYYTEKGVVVCKEKRCMLQR